jgi:hypothetical protein
MSEQNNINMPNFEYNANASVVRFEVLAPVTLHSAVCIYKRFEETSVLHLPPCCWR